MKRAMYKVPGDLGMRRLAELILAGFKLAE